MNTFGVAAGLFLCFSNTEGLAMSVISVPLLLTVVKIVLGRFHLD